MNCRYFRSQAHRCSSLARTRVWRSTNNTCARRPSRSAIPLVLVSCCARYASISSMQCDRSLHEIRRLCDCFPDPERVGLVHGECLARQLVRLRQQADNARHCRFLSQRLFAAPLLRSTSDGQQRSLSNTGRHICGSRLVCVLKSKSICLCLSKARCYMWVA